MNTFERVIKRASTLPYALVSLIFFSPLIALIALLIKREDPKGDVIYRQERIGYKGKPLRYISSALCVWMLRRGIVPSYSPMGIAV